MGRVETLVHNFQGMGSQAIMFVCSIDTLLSRTYNLLETAIELFKWAVAGRNFYARLYHLKMHLLITIHMRRFTCFPFFYSCLAHGEKVSTTHMLK